MPTIAIVGAGPGLGLSIARVFGKNGFQVALLSRTQASVEELAEGLAGDGIEAAGFAADVLDRPSLVDAFARVKERFGEVDVLEYSPAQHTPNPALTPVDVLEVTVESIQPQIEFYLYGAVTAVRQVLPEMLARGTGTLLFTTGASSLLPVPPFGNIGIAGGALRNWVLNLNVALAEKGIYAAHIPLATWIGKGGPETQPDTIAELYWKLYTKRAEPEHLYSTLPPD
jgi:NAD(P)-dependent dehydrogenase (short-subunit alcohol dehydrogenase family)